MRSPRPIQWFLPLALLLAAPTVASAAISEVWSTPHADRYHVYDFVDLDGNGTLEVLTGEYTTGSREYIGVRSAATGHLLAQTDALYEPSDLFAVELDGNGTRRILFTTELDDRLNCLQFEGPAGPLSVAWSVRPLIQAPFQLEFADLDGDGRLYILFDQPTEPGAFVAYDHRGGLVGSYEPDVSPQATYDGRLIGNFDSDPNEEIMVMHHDGPHQQLALVESTGLVNVIAPQGGLRSVQLGASRPNPAAARARISYSIASRGPVTLRLLDAQGRSVRELVNGEKPAGSHEAIWDGRDASGRAAPAGVYFYELSASGQRVSRRMIRLQAVR